MQHNAKDISGQRFGKLVAIRPTASRIGGSIVWECQCDCGNTTLATQQNLKRGDKKSCGCMNHQNLIGHTFGEFTVISFAYSRGQRRYWNCRCSCGEIVVLDTYTLNSGKKTHCSSHYHMNPLTIDLTGKRFGKLTVLNKMPYNDKFNRILWKCKCDCGNEKIIIGSYLRNGDVNSCGCIVSKGELTIEQWLQDNQIEFQTQFTFNDLLGDKDYLRFDFAILQNGELKGLIEVQGPQHWLKSNEWHTDKLIRYDKKKREYCKSNDIPLLAIPYNHGKLKINLVSLFCKMLLKEQLNEQ